VKKISKRIGAIVIAITFLLSINGVAVYAADSVYASIGDSADCEGRVYLSTTGATASTYCDVPTVNVKITLNYYYYDKYSNKVYPPISSNKSYLGTVSISAKKPSDSKYESLKAIAIHRVTDHDQVWTATTEDHVISTPDN